MINYEEIFVCFLENDKFAGCFLKTKTLQTTNPFSFSVSLEKDVLDVYCFLDNINIKEKPWACYGVKHKKIIEEKFEKNNLFPFSDRFFDIKAMVPIVFDTESEVSMKKIFQLMNIPIPETKTSKDGAINSAIILKELLRGPGAVDGNFVVCETKRNSVKTTKPLFKRETREIKCL